jgi:uncharacterized membrane protein
MAHKRRNGQIRVWLTPLLYAVAAIVAGTIVPRSTSILLPKFTSTMSVASAIGMYSAIASGMITLTGIVFSLIFVMIQFSATAYSPRLVLWIARDPVMSHALGTFTATFLYALSALAWVDRNGSGRVPLVSLGLVAMLLLASVALFISLIQRVGMLQVQRMLVFTGNQGREVIEKLYPPIEISKISDSIEIDRLRRVQTVLHRGDPMTLQALDTTALVQIAKQGGCVIEMLAAVGDSVLDSTPICRIYGGQGSLSRENLAGAIEFGIERTFEQDPKYAIRLLVDIAIRALSSAINDPTTAVQALDQIEDLLLRLGRRRLEIGAFRDEHGDLRVLIPFPSWEDFLRLAFDEIRFCGAKSVQVMRRMRALVSELISVLPEERRPALWYWQERLQTSIERTFVDAEDILDASAEDRQGIGISRRTKLSS